LKRLLNAEEVAEALGVRPGWVYQEVRAGRIPHIRLGRYCRFNADSIEAWAAERERGPVPQSPTTVTPRPQPKAAVLPNKGGEPR
jgi:excisionase family DNA binding protein